MQDAIRLIEELQESLESYERRPPSRFEGNVSYESEPDCTCGVCGEEVAFRRSNVVDGEKFDYDQWDSEALDEWHEPFEQDRICLDCEREFVQNGGEFDQWRYVGFEKCEPCYGDGEHWSDEVEEVVVCEECDGTGALSTTDEDD